VVVVIFIIFYWPAAQRGWGDGGGLICPEISNKSIWGGGGGCMMSINGGWPR